MYPSNQVNIRRWTLQAPKITQKQISQLPQGRANSKTTLTSRSALSQSWTATTTNTNPQPINTPSVLISLAGWRQVHPNQTYINRNHTADKPPMTPQGGFMYNKIYLRQATPLSTHRTPTNAKQKIKRVAIAV